jgi:hypothetical protein
MSASQRARPLPARFRYPAGTPPDKIRQAEQTPGERQLGTVTTSLQREAHELEFEQGDAYAPELPAWLRGPMAGIVTLITIIAGLAALGYLFLKIRKRTRLAEAPAPSVRPVFSSLRSPGTHHPAASPRWVFPREEAG